MSRMLKVVYLLPIFFLILAVLTKAEPAYADSYLSKTLTWQGNNINVTISDPSRMPTTEDHAITFTITFEKGFAKTLTYKGIVLNKDTVIKDTRQQCTLKFGNFRWFTADKSDPAGKTLKFTYEPFPNGPCSGARTLYFAVWVGDVSSLDVDPSAIMVKPSDFPFPVEQPGNTVPRIEPSNASQTGGTYYTGDKDLPKVNLYNARKGNSYEFWWDDSAFARDTYKATEDGNVLNLPLWKNWDNYDKYPLGRKKLCMELGDNHWVRGLTCRYTADPPFNFVGGPVPAPAPPADGSCLVDYLASHLPTLAESDALSVHVEFLPPNQPFWVQLKKDDQEVPNTSKKITSDNNGKLDYNNMVTKMPIGDNYMVTVSDDPSNPKKSCNTRTFNVTPFGSNKQIIPFCTDMTKCTSGGGATIPLCGDDLDKQGAAVATAIGCIHTEPLQFAQDLLKFVLGISGGLAFLMMLLGAFQMLTSAGNPETLNAGKSRLTSAIIGLLLVIFTLLLLQIIGFDILHLPGFSR